MREAQLPRRSNTSFAGASSSRPQLRRSNAQPRHQSKDNAFAVGKRIVCRHPGRRERAMHEGRAAAVKGLHDPIIAWAFASNCQRRLPLVTVDSKSSVSDDAVSVECLHAFRRQRRVPTVIEPARNREAIRRGGGATVIRARQLQTDREPGMNSNVAVHGVSGDIGARCLARPRCLLQPHRVRVLRVRGPRQRLRASRPPTNDSLR